MHNSVEHRTVTEVAAASSKEILALLMTRWAKTQTYFDHSDFPRLTRQF